MKIANDRTMRSIGRAVLSRKVGREVTGAGGHGRHEASISVLYTHTACMSMLHVHAACQFCMCMMQVHASCYASCTRMFMLLVHAACPYGKSVLSFLYIYIGQDRQNRTDRTGGQAEQDRQCRTVRTGQEEQDRQG